MVPLCSADALADELVQKLRDGMSLVDGRLVLRLGMALMAIPLTSGPI
jgi:hypothetical protein